MLRNLALLGLSRSNQRWHVVCCWQFTSLHLPRRQSEIFKVSMGMGLVPFGFCFLSTDGRGWTQIYTAASSDILFPFLFLRSGH